MKDGSVEHMRPIIEQQAARIAELEREKDEAEAAAGKLRAALADVAVVVEVIGEEIRASERVYPEMSLKLKAGIVHAQDSLRSAVAPERRQNQRAPGTE